MMRKAAFWRFGDDAFSQFAGSLTLNLAWAELVSTTSYVESDGTFAFAQPLGLPVNLTTDLYSELESFAQEARLVSLRPGPFGWILGVFYQDSATRGGLAIPDFGLDATTMSDREQISVYGEVSYRLTDSLRATVGLRRYSETGEDSVALEFSGFAFPPQTGDGDFAKTIAKFLVSYRPNDRLNVYASASQGFRVGGVNLSRSPLDPTTFEPDSLWAYELGAKFVAYDGRLSGNLAAFFNDWSDIQIFQFGLGGGIVLNGGEAHTAGLEGQLNFRLADSLVAGVGGSIMQANFDETVAASGIFEDARIPDVAERNVSVRLDYSSALANGWGYFAHLDAIYAGDQVNPDQSGKQDSAITLNARTGLVLENWEVALFAPKYRRQPGALRIQRFLLRRGAAPHHRGRGGLQVLNPGSTPVANESVCGRRAAPPIQRALFWWVPHQSRTGFLISGASPLPFRSSKLTTDAE